MAHLRLRLHRRVARHLRRRHLRRRLLLRRHLLRRHRPLRRLPLRRSSFALAASAACAACSLPSAPPNGLRPPPPRIAIVVAERAANGIRLVAIDEHGDRQLVVVTPAATLARDTNPAISPNDRFVVFASSRGRAFDETSLWLAPVAPDALPHALTASAAIDSQPTWVPDGSAIVFARAVPGGNFDLYRLAIDRDGNASGAPEQLTTGAGHEVTPSVARDGSIVYAEVTPHGDGAASVDSHLELRTPDGVIVRLTEGPSDTTPAFSPDGKTIAFSAATRRTTPGGDMIDADLWRIKATGGGAGERIVDLPLTDESGPVWSPDGQFLFATSALRDSRAKAVFSSVIAIDMQAHPPVARMLEDHAGLFPRLTPALTHAALDRKALDADPEYLPELARLLAPAMAQAKPQ